MYRIDSSKAQQESSPNATLKSIKIYEKCKMYPRTLPAGRPYIELIPAPDVFIDAELFAAVVPVDVSL